MPIWLTAVLVTAIVRTCIAALGLYTVSYIGMDVLFTQAMTVVAGADGAGNSVAQLAQLSGIADGINLMVSAFNVRLALWTAKKFKVL